MKIIRMIKREKALKNMSNSIIRMVGKDNYGTMLAIMADSLYNLVKDVGSREIRTVELKYNDFFSTKFDFKNREYVD